MSDFDYKSLTSTELQEIFSGISFKLTPRWNQYVSLAHASSRRREAYFHDVAAGKTPLALMTAQMWGCKKLLVVCPTSALGAWERDVPKASNYSIQFLCDPDTRKRRSTLDRWKHDVYVTHYEGLKTLFAGIFVITTYICPVCYKRDEHVSEEPVDRIVCSKCRKSFASKGNSKSVRKWLIDPQRFKYPFDCLILDEVHRCAEYKSLQSQICLRLSQQVQCAMGLSGTPIDHNLLEMFNIMLVLDLGRSLGTNFFTYRNAYFKKYGFNWELKTGAQEQILARIRESSISFGIDECIDLPPIIEEVQTIPAFDEYHRVHDQIISGQVDHKGHTVKFVTDPGRLEALRQLCNGFIYTKDEEREVIVLDHQPKVDALIDIITDTGKKVLVFYHYSATRLIIEAGLRKAGILYVSMYGSQPIAERRSAEKQFRNDLTVRTLIAQKTIASEGFDGTAASIVVYFSPVGSPKVRTQCHGRIRRPEQQESKLVSMDLAIKGSMDTSVIKNRGDRFDFVKDCMEYLRNVRNQET